MGVSGNGVFSAPNGHGTMLTMKFHGMLFSDRPIFVDRQKCHGIGWSKNWGHLQILCDQKVPELRVGVVCS